MKKICCLFPAVLLLLGGCHGVGEKAFSLTVIYGVMAALSLALLIGCICTFGKFGPPRTGRSGSPSARCGIT